jgi:hypothetical protein
MPRPASRNLLESVPLAALALAGVWAATAGPLLLSGSRWGIWDWDHHFALAEVERLALLEHGVVPLWNPYIAGGLPVLQHPLFASFCPDFLIVLLLGVPVGLKVLVAFRLAVGLAGGLLLGRALGLPTLVAAFLSILMNASGAYTAHLVYGHAEWSLLGYLPWTLLALLRFAGGGRPAWGLGAVAGAALLYLGGGTYLLFPLAFLWGVWALVEGARSRRIGWVVRAVLPFVIAAPLVGAKLLPSWELFRDHPRRLGAMKPLFAPAPPVPWSEVPRALGYVFLERGATFPDDPGVLRHRPAKDYTRAHLNARWPVLDFINFSGYTGLVPVLLVPFAFVGRARVVPAVAAGSGLLLLLVLSDPIGRSTGFYPWQSLRELPLLGTLRTSGRFLAVAVAGLSILSAFGLHELLRRWRPLGPVTAGVFGGVVLLAVAADHGLRNAGTLSRAFPYESVRVEAADAFVTDLLPAHGFDYATVVARVGARAGHSNLFLGTGVVPRGQPSYRGEAHLERSGGTVRLVEIRPNEVVVEVRADRSDVLVINQTWLPAWRRLDRPALLSPGIALTLATLLGLGGWLAWDLRKGRA